jgi:glycosyltransferase involved in cell wall biosynthesis
MSEESKGDSLYKLSILLPTVESRREQFLKLFQHIKDQCINFPVEIRSICDNKEMPIGKKRQQLLEEATGEYIVFIDDDDWIADNYIKEVLNALGNDAVSFLIQCTFDGGRKCLAKASMKYGWKENVDGYRYVRPIYHKSPVKRELALKAGFPPLRFEEDVPYSMKLKAYVKSETFINQVMYYYNYKTENHIIKYGFDKD